MSDVDTKLSAARTRLILDKPFLGALVLRLPMIEADPEWCKSTATDARSFYYNYDYINGLSLEQTQFVLAHEALHCALSHFARRMHRDKHRWDLSCDFAINPLLVADGLTPAPDVLLMVDYEGMTAEEIYPLLDEHENLTPHDDHIYDDENQKEGGQRGAGGGYEGENREKGGGSKEKRDQQAKGGGKGEQGESTNGQSKPSSSSGQGKGAGKPPPLSKEEQEQLSVQWAQRMAGAHQTAMQAGKMSGLLARMIEHLLQPQLPWRMLLARYFTANAREDYNWSRPSRREGEAIMPSLRSHAIDVVVGLDISGSIHDREMEEFLAEVNAIKGQASARVALLACDSELDPAGPWHYEPWEEFALPKAFTGGGSTDFRPVFDWIEQQGRHPDVVVYFSDGHGHFPESPPPYPVLWLIKGKEPVPWGQRIQLN